MLDNTESGSVTFIRLYKSPQVSFGFTGDIPKWANTVTYKDSDDRERKRASYKTIKGRVTEVKFQKVDRFKRTDLNVTLVGKTGDKMILQLPFIYEGKAVYGISTEAESFIRQAAREDIDWSKRIKFGCGGETRKSGENVYVDAKLFMSYEEGGNSFKWLFTKDDPGGKPQWEKEVMEKQDDLTGEVEEKIVWSRKKESLFYYNLVQDKIAPAVAKALEETPVNSAATNSILEDDPESITADTKLEEAENLFDGDDSFGDSTEKDDLPF